MNFRNYLDNGNIVETLKTKYFCCIIGEKTENIAKSPQLWNHCFNESSLDITYLPFDVSRQNLQPLVKSLRENERFLGGSVTAPYKIAMMELLDGVDELAQNIGAINCVVRTKKGKLLGFNTDAKGATDALVKIGPRGSGAPLFSSLKDKKIAVLGIGGAGRAVAVSLASQVGESGKIYLFNRNREKSNELSEKLNSIYGNTFPMENSSELSELDLDIVLNSSLCGQKGIRGQDKKTTLEPFCVLGPVNPNFLEPGNSLESAESILVTQGWDKIQENHKASFEIAKSLKSSVLFYDIVYDPYETVFLKFGRWTGHRVLNGKTMNICQAVDAYVNNVGNEHQTIFKFKDQTNYQNVYNLMAEVW